MKRIKTEQAITLSDTIKEAQKKYPGLNKKTAIEQFNYLQFLITKSRDIDSERLQAAYTKSSLLSLLLYIKEN